MLTAIGVPGRQIEQAFATTVVVPRSKRDPVLPPGRVAGLHVYQHLIDDHGP